MNFSKKWQMTRAEFFLKNLKCIYPDAVSKH